MNFGPPGTLSPSQALLSTPPLPGTPFTPTGPLLLIALKFRDCEGLQNLGCPCLSCTSWPSSLKTSPFFWGAIERYENFHSREEIFFPLQKDEGQTERQTDKFSWGEKLYSHFLL